jgi:hypothetical protein
MTIDWQLIAVAVASRVQYEVACGRGRLLTEQVVRLALAEAIQSQVSGKLVPEFNHPDIPGNSSLDLVVMTPRDKKIEVAIELKWVRRTTDKVSRPWMQEIVGDLLRLECLSEGLWHQSQRAVVVVGEVDSLNSNVWDRQVNAGKERRRITGQLLPGKGHFKEEHDDRKPVLVDLKAIGLPYRNFLRGAAPEIYKQLPGCYLVDMSAFHRTMPNGIECVVWTVSRPVGRRNEFSGEEVWTVNEETKASSQTTDAA